MSAKSKDEKVKTVFVYIIIALFVFLIGACTFGGGGSSSSNVSDAEVKAYEDKKKADCEAKTDTYHKCSYSNWEGRCVCKTR